jgi:hypothetical protein
MQRRPSERIKLQGSRSLPPPGRPTPWGTPKAQALGATHSAALAFLEQLRAAIVTDADEALDLVYSTIDELLRQGDFRQVDEMLASVSTSLPIVHLLAFVSISRTARGDLHAWRPLVERVRAHLSKVVPNRVEELLAGFE